VALLEELAAVEVDSLTPLQALTTLADLRAQAKAASTL